MSGNSGFFRAGELLGISWFRLYLADSLAEKFDKSKPGDEILRWFILHLAVQAGSGHLRCDLETLEEDMRDWYNTGERPLKEIDESLPGRTAEAAQKLIEEGLESGLIGMLDDEDSTGESLGIPRPPLVLTHDGKQLYFLRRRKEEDRFINALEMRSRPAAGTAVTGDTDATAVTGTTGDTDATVVTGTTGKTDVTGATDATGILDATGEFSVQPPQSAFAGIPSDSIPDTPAGALYRGLSSGRRLLLLAGGPGTGKTTTVARLLELLNPQPGGLEVILAAPTGRAAARMSESLNITGRTAGRTIHSLLGLYPGRPPRHDADCPLAADLVIVDEASMVDLPLMNALLTALPESAALLLVGDPDQLPSVEAGAVLGDLLYGAAEAAEAAAAARGGGPGQSVVSKFVTAAEAESEAVEAVKAVPEVMAPPRAGVFSAADETEKRFSRQNSPLAGAVIRLTKVYRSDTAILEAASALREGDFKTLNGIVSAPSGAVRLHAPGSPDTMARIIGREFKAAVESVENDFSESENLSGIFENFAAHAVLSPLRRGHWGVPAMNERISWLLGGSASPFPGMPVMILRNDPGRNLWNGDRGVIVSLEGRLRAAFPDAEGVRSFPLAALPGWEPAWVQTIHKSQGSEFDSVTVLLPEGAERLLSREILYTAFTRARHTVNLYADLKTVKAALERRVIRHSRIRKWAAGN